jgi:hypothetical protein
MGFHQFFDHVVLTAFVLSGSEVVEEQFGEAVSFLLGPGGADYVGINSYDSSFPAI